jgi:NAD(P)H-nitrite reductase large subunit
MCAATADAAAPRRPFATDLDEQTLIRYIDRLLMFYAHRGQTATHLGLDGEHGRGLDYLSR